MIRIFTQSLLAILLCLASIGSFAVERVYYIAAEEIEWDYAPSGINKMMGRPFTREEQEFVGRSPETIGSRYIKAVFREYEDAGFQRVKKRTQDETHLGVLGPTLHAEVGDTIKIIFRNKASRLYSMHPHGVFYDKASEGAPYNDGTTGADKADDAVVPGSEHVYIWEVPERAGPAAGDPDSIAWLYHSHRKSIADSNAGLVGAIIITRKGRANAAGRPVDVDREFVTLFTIFDENESWYLEENIRKFTDPGRVDVDDHEFLESNLMHSMNGYVYGNMPGLEMDQCDKVRWYVMALGTEVDLHTPHWHGSTGVWNGNRVDVVELMPASMKVVDIVADNPGTWMYHCHVNDHIKAGMMALYTVQPGAKECR